jgi:hypothetical protein
VHVRFEPVAMAKKTGVLRAISSCINIGQYYFFSKATTIKPDLLQGGGTI